VLKKVTTASSFNSQVVTANTTPQYSVDNPCLIPKQGAGCNDQKTERLEGKTVTKSQLLLQGGPQQARGDPFIQRREHKSILNEEG